jgi:tight adherence protein C
MLGQAPYVLFSLLLGAAVFGIVWALTPRDLAGRAAAGALPGGPEGAHDAVLVHALRPFYALFLPPARALAVPPYRARIERQFVASGMPGLMSADEFIAYKLAMGVFFTAMFGVLLGFVIMGFSVPVVVLVLLFVLGSFFPDLWLTGLVRQRQLLIRRSLPYVMDLLTLSVEAGLDFIAGVHKVCEKARSGPLVDELSFTLREIQVGATRQQALRNLAQRVDMQEIRSFSALLIQADVLGASIGPVLRAQSDLLRTQRFQAAERAGAYAATKLLFPLILFIMPAVFIVIFGPIALNFIYGDAVIGG